MRPKAPVSEWFKIEAAARRESSRPAAPPAHRAATPAIPPPPRVPAEAQPLLDAALREDGDTFDAGVLDHLFDDLPPIDLPIPFALSELDAPIPFAVTERATADDANERRIQGLLEDGNRLLEEARAARRAEADAKVEAAVWRERAMRWREAARRMDPAWRDA